MSTPASTTPPQQQNTSSNSATVLSTSTSSASSSVIDTNSPTLSSSSASSIAPANAGINITTSNQPPTISITNSPNSTVTNKQATSLDSTEHITITYQDDASSVWKYVEVELPNHLPLRNISWKTKTGHTKVVDKMPIEILQYNDERIRPSYDNQTLYRKPYLYLYLVHCDDPDIYKNTIRGKIKNWVSQMTEKGQEWLIVYVSLGPKRFGEITSKLSRTVYDRIKSDFNVKRDRCCQLRFLDDSNRNDDLWDDLLMKMKEGIIASAEQYLTTYEDEIRKMDAKRNLPGWSYQNFFFIKEGLALIYERAQLYEDALMQYFELEVLFTENRSQFELITDPGRLESNDRSCSGNILDTSTKDFRKLIHENKISLFDFKIYLFARQCKLLFLLKKPIEAATKSISFITSISMIIKQFPNSFSPMFKESWTFSTSMELINACQDSFERIISSSQQTTGTNQTVQKVNKSTTPSISRLLGAFGTPFSSSSSSTGTSGSTNPNVNNNSKSSIPSSGSSGNLSGINSLTVAGSSIIAGLSGSQSLNNLQSAQISQALNTNSWIRTPSLNLASDLSERQLEKQDRENLDFLLSDLTYSAAQRLEELAVKIGFLPEDDYNDMFFQKVEKIINNENANKPIEPIDTLSLFSYPTLQNNLQTSKQFQQLYVDLLNKVEKLYNQSNRLRSISRLKFSLANLYFKQKDYQLAESLFRPITNLYSREGWTFIDYAIRTRLSYCQKQLGYLVDYVTTCVSLLAPGLLLSKAEKDYYLSEILQLSNDPQLVIVQSMIPLFKCKVTYTQKEPVYRYLETIKINVKIKSNLTSPVKFNSGSVSFLRTNNSSGSSSSSSGDKLVFQLNDFVIEPGLNHYQFSTLASIKSTFVKDSIWLKLGSLSFGHSLRESDKSEIKITDSESQITLESFAKSPLLLCSIQYIGIKLQTNSDTIEAGVLSFTSPTGATIIPTPSITFIQTDNNTNTSQAKTINLVNDKLPLSQIGYNQTLEFYLPLMAVNPDTFTHQIRIELQHQKQTKEKFSSSLVSSTLFVNPFSVEESVISVNNRLFLKTILQCTTPNMIQLNSYSLKGCDLEYQDPSTTTNSFYFIKDHNQSLFNNNSLINLYPGQVISLVFEIKKYNENDINKKMTLNLKYTSKMPTPQSEYEKSFVKECKPLWRDQNEFNWPILIECPSYLYQVDLNITSKAYLGTLVPFEISITNLKPKNLENQSTTLNQLQYQIEIDPTIWMMSGKNKNSFFIDDGQKITFTCDLIPISSGSLPIPKVSLLGVDPLNIFSPKNLNENIYVFPTPQFYSCHQAQDLNNNSNNNNVKTTK
ncbi:hypothetical protein DICPUDRAFT_86772 [Dictyostelium purpureum]|uniref:Uncharacterized protein n=1 Tax=Dictyostelium purpureum TaxID=5786 RepID=F0ZDS6_DICPU|nr:uncharacterized protein DICPUDRAFT_86772 [Dictyostelium purpureum]EGC37898.1 hypothetical protein DICPUDRAFT_86772 [Dictyostelium purpureum]|eukprot:XP_003285558.1 hypothetical protein DICPUDRAFT_86772 [Dictyostelium purpureum]